LGEVTIRIRRDNKIYSGHSADTDVVVAAANAYVNALNRLILSQKKNSIHPQFDNLENSDSQFLPNTANKIIFLGLLSSIKKSLLIL